MRGCLLLSATVDHELFWLKAAAMELLLFLLFSLQSINQLALMNWYRFTGRAVIELKALKGCYSSAGNSPGSGTARSGWLIYILSLLRRHNCFIYNSKCSDTEKRLQWMNVRKREMIGARQTAAHQAIAAMSVQDCLLKSFAVQMMVQ